MTVYTDTIGFNKGSAAANLPHDATNTTGVIKVRLNTASIAAARTAAGATALGAGDGIQAISLPANVFVHAVGLNVITVHGGTMTIDVGDGSTTDGWLDGVNGNSATSYASTLVLAEGTPNTVTGYTKGKLYTAADTIDVIFVNAPGVVVIDVWAVVSYVG